ncbi:unnamed protein product [Pseudo-nitzschia multistriata]|uniref:MalT-like TPR region domain-containing protein n=1 Tax=Pseudo-nitzschia multistriata TaxID=183589 RepID=A0A448ZCE7_9STRA|nr:unnamed protein product [Pseudo-nitzschia multistriata]
MSKSYEPGHCKSQKARAAISNTTSHIYGDYKSMETKPTVSNSKSRLPPDDKKPHPTKATKSSLMSQTNSDGKAHKFKDTISGTSFTLACDYKSHKTKVTISSPTSPTTPDQTFYPVLYTSSSITNGSQHVHSESETGTLASICSAQTKKTATTSKNITTRLKRSKPSTNRKMELLVKEGIEFYKNEQYANALKSFNTVLKSQMLCSSTERDDDPLIANTLANIGCVYLRQNRHQLAVESLQECVQMMLRLKASGGIDDDSPTKASLAGVLNNIGTAKSLQGDHQAGLPYYWGALRDAMAVRKRNGENSSTTKNKKEIANACYNIGRVSMFQQEYSIAKNMLKESLRLEKELYGNQSIETVDTLNLIGFVHYRTKSFNDAVLAFTEALSITTAVYGSVHGTVAVSLLNVGMVLEKEEDLVGALRCFSTAEEIGTRLGLGRDDRCMRTATESASKIRRDLFSPSSPVQTEERSPSNSSSNPNDRDAEARTPTAEIPVIRSEKKRSHSNKTPSPRAEINKYDSRSKPRAPKSHTRNEYSERFNEEEPTDYREDPFWEADNASIVAERREV